MKTLCEIKGHVIPFNLIECIGPIEYDNALKGMPSYVFTINIKSENYFVLKHTSEKSLNLVRDDIIKRWEEYNLLGIENAR